MFAPIKQRIDQILNAKNNSTSRLYQAVIQLNAILINKFHLQHFNLDLWLKIANFLLQSYENFRSELKTIESVKQLSLVFNSISCLLNAEQFINRQCIAHILLICEDFVNLFGNKLTSCHGHIMKIIRLLSDLKIIEAHQVGTRIIEMFRPKNNLFLNEIFRFALVCPQPITSLLEMDFHSEIFVDEIEFIEGTFRASRYANLEKFVYMRALTLATTDQPPPKRMKRENLQLQIMAFSKNSDIDLVFDLISSNESLFWGLICLGMNAHLNTMRVFEFSIKYLQSEASSSACFCLGECIRILNLNRFNADQFKLITDVVMSLKSIRASPGSMYLVDQIMQVKVLSDKFNKLKQQNLVKFKRMEFVPHFQRELEFVTDSGCGYFLLEYTKNKLFTDCVRCIVVHALQNTPIECQFPKFEAFSLDDLRDIFWFASMATVNKFSKEYIDAFLKLGQFDAIDNFEVKSALKVLNSNSVQVVGFALLGVGWSKLDTCCAGDLRELQPLLQSYEFQRDISFLSNIALLCGHSRFHQSAEVSQLLNFVMKISFQHSEFSSLKVSICQNTYLPLTQTIELMSATDDIMCLEVVKKRKFEGVERVTDLINLFDTLEIKLRACFHLLKSRSIGACDVIQVCSFKREVVEMICSCIEVDETYLANACYVGLKLKNFDVDFECSLKDVGNQMIRIFSTPHIERAPGKVLAITESLSRLCFRVLNSYDIMDLIRRSYNYLYESLKSVDVEIVCCWVENVAALVYVNELYMLDTQIRQLLSSNIFNTDKSIYFCRMAGALHLAKLYNCMDFVFKNAPPNPLLTDLETLIKNTDLENALKTAIMLHNSETSTSHDLWLMVLEYFSKSLEQNECESTLELANSITTEQPPEFVHNLIYWSRVGKFNGKLGSLIGRLIAHQHAVEHKLNLSYEESLKELYAKLPYHRKWSLNPFMSRVAEFRKEQPLYESLPVGMWDNEAVLRSPLTKKSDEDKEFYRFASKLLNAALQSLALPNMGAHIVEDIPELALEFLPKLVAHQQHKCRNHSSDLGANVVVDLLNQATSKYSTQKVKELMVNIAYCCFQVNATKNLVLTDLVSVSQSLLQTCNNKNALYVGIGASELIYNATPSYIHQQANTNALETFYLNLKEDEYRSAYLQSLPVKNTVNAISSELGINSIWPRLNIGLERLEVYNHQTDFKFEKNLEEAGLWKFANKVTNSTDKFFDFEKLWWLQEWDTLDVSIAQDTKNCSKFINFEYSALAFYFANLKSENETFEYLFKISPPTSDIYTHFAQIVSKKSSTNIDLGNAVVRQGRELANTTDPLSLAFELRDMCEYLLTNGQINEFVKTGMKLERLASNNAQKFPAIKCISLLQSAKVQWTLGNESMAIHTLKFLLEELDSLNESQPLEFESEETPLIDSEIIVFDTPSLELNKKPPSLVNIGHVYALLGTYSHNARNELDSDIMTNYFQIALANLNDFDADNGFVYHSFAKFCDGCLQEGDLERLIIESKEARERTKKQMEYLRQLSSTESSSTNDAPQGKMLQTQRLMQSQNENLKNLNMHKSVLITRAIENYLRSMFTCDKYQNDTGRFIALWLENCNNDEVNAVIKLQLCPSSIPTGNYLELEKPVFKFLPWMNQLMSRLNSKGQKSFQELLNAIVFKALLNHPYHTVWQLMNIVSTTPVSGMENSSHRKQSAVQLMNAYELINKTQPRMDKFTKFGKNIRALGFLKATTSELDLKNAGVNLYKFWVQQLPQLDLPPPTLTIQVNMACNYADVPTISLVSRKATVAGGLSRPKIVKLTLSNGKRHHMILKGTKRDDLRQDAIMQQVFQLTNDVLRMSPKTRKLRIRTYNVVPHGANAGAIEFVSHTLSLKEVLEPLHKEFGGPQECSLREARQIISQSLQSSPATRLNAFLKVANRTRPQMRHYWPLNFHDLQSCFHARNLYSSSCAVMSIVGYIIGLGDRHASNILLDHKTGEVVHIDFGIAFDQGQLLSIPERVPFRLTRDMVDGMGLSGTDGVFRYSAEHTLSVMRTEQQKIITVLEVLKHDTLYSWQLPPIKPNSVDNNLMVNYPIDSREADQALDTVKKKLAGKLSCPAEVRDLVTQAVNFKNLAMMFQGWSAFY